MKLSKRAEKLRDELADADSYNQWADKQPDKNNYMHTYIRGFDAGYSAARLEAKALEDALKHTWPGPYGENVNRFNRDTLKKYREEE